MSRTMSDKPDGLTRRGFLTATAAAVALPNGLAIDALDLDAATRADLEAFAQPVLRETRWIDELPLDGVQPAFLHAADDDWR